MNRLLTLCLIVLIQKINAQMPYSFYAFYPVAQTHIMNPSVEPVERFTFGILNSGIYLQNTAFRPMEFFLKDSDINQYLESSVSKMNPSDFLNLDVQTDLIFIGFKIGKLYFSAGSFNRKSIIFGYPANLLKLAYFGNTNFQNQTVNLLGNSIEIFDYSAIHLGSQFQFKFGSIGGRIKLLNGIQSFKTEATKAEVTFYDTTWALSTDILVRSSGKLSELSQNMIDVSNHFIPGSTGNSGISFDLGVTFDITEKLRLTASIADVGRIRWQQNLTEYYSSGSTTFKGLNINLAEENQNYSFNEVIDSVNSALDIKERPGSQYSTELPLRFTGIVDYQLYRSHRVTGIFDYRMWNDLRIVGLSGQYHLPVSSWFYFMGSYSVINNNFSNIGAGFIVKILGIQFYAVTDQINVLFSPEKLNLISFRTGLNISLSSPEYYQKKTTNKPQQ